MRICCACVFVPVALALVLGGAATGGDKKAETVEKKTEEVKGAKGSKGATEPVTPPVLLTAPAAPGQVEVRFSNGSVVMMTLLQGHIEIVTDYGKLLVPARDIRAIEFGIHATAAEKRKLDEAIERLGSASHSERETAGQDLVAMGPLAYLRALAACKAKDLEVSRRRGGRQGDSREVSDPPVAHARGRPGAHAQVQHCRPYQHAIVQGARRRLRRSRLAAGAHAGDPLAGGRYEEASNHRCGDLRRAEQPEVDGDGDPSGATHRRAPSPRPARSTCSRKTAAARACAGRTAWAAWRWVAADSSTTVRPAAS